MGNAGPHGNALGIRPLGRSALALLRALRPKQWIKNGLIFLPFLFAVDFVWSPDDPASLVESLSRTSLVFLAFCCLSGGVYLLNDVMDRDLDRMHPAKKGRPIASGKVSVPAALALMAVLAVAGLAVMSPLGLWVGVTGVLYLAVSGAYCLGLKQVVVLDLLAVAAGYVIRVGAGALAIGTPFSPWLYVVTGAAALFIVMGRRYAEVRLSTGNESQQRPVLAHYTGPFVGQLLSIAGTAALVSYTLYTVEAERLPDNHTMLLTVPLVVFGLFRYLYLLHTHPEAESPEQLIYKDWPLAVSVVAWVGLAALVLLLNR